MYARGYTSILFPIPRCSHIIILLHYLLIIFSFVRYAAVFDKTVQ